MEKSSVKNVKIALKYSKKILEKYASDGEACARIGAILGNGSKKEIEALSYFGRKYCYIYRLAEEVSDVVNLDNNLSRRIKYETIPLPILYAAKKSKKNERKIESIVYGPITEQDLEVLQNLCVMSGGFNYVHKLAKESINSGIKKLKFILPSKTKEELIFLINNVYIFDSV